MIKFKCYITALIKVRDYMGYSKKFDGTTVMLGEVNARKLEEAKKHINEAINLLYEIR